MAYVCREGSWGQQTWVQFPAPLSGWVSVGTFPASLSLGFSIIFVVEIKAEMVSVSYHIQGAQKQVQLGASLVVQWLRLHTSTAETLVGELRSPMPRGATKK